ncbi:ATP-binding protein [Dongia soli]|uniref:histidine kinase n=1 Tax=Dongia soli TaxID=600628 RepID=A0ABU5EE47_9PROT|nr:ATP-binding protein [Dongia soli]MDY0884620.1 ATP-binding protein [Dongia soli]
MQQAVTSPGLIDLAGYPIRSESDIVLIRQQAQRLAQGLGFDRQDQTRIATAVSEIVRNALQHGGGGTIKFAIEAPVEASAETSVAARDETQYLVADIGDCGPGIEQLEDVLQGRGGNNAVGLVAARRLMERFEIDSSPATGTHIRMKKRLPRSYALDDGALKTLTAGLSARAAEEPVALVQHLNHELALCLEELNSRQEELERLSAELEDTNRGVVALYSELDDKAEELKQASELKSRFLSNMGHEFRTPLNSILALSGLLLDGLDGSLTSEQSRQVTYIRHAAEGLTELVNDLLDLAKVESGNVDLRPRDFTVHELFGSLRGMLKPLSLNDQVALIFDEGRDLPPLRTDMGKLSQILRNFISNALKFTEEGEVRVTARLTPDRRRMVFAVRDTGIGIAPEHHEAVFDEFLQIENRLQARYKGTGLGLPLSRKLAELLGGEVTLESQLGEGSTFTLYIPASGGHAPAADSEQARESGLAPQQSAFAAKSILVIDDEEAFRYVLRQLMVDTGYRILEANDGAAGLDLMRAQHPDAVFLDLQMPAMNGYQVLDRLAADPALKDIPVVICTSSVLDAADRDRLAAATAVLPKNELTRDAVSAMLKQLHLAEGGK